MARSKGQEGLLVDIDTGTLRRDHVLVQRLPGMVLFLGLGPRAQRLCRFAFGDAGDPDPFITRCRSIAVAVEGGRLAKAQQAGVPRRALEIEDRVLRRLAIAEALAKAGYDPDEPRDEHGRWTTGGAAVASANDAAAIGLATEGFASSLARPAGSLFGDLAPDALAGLAELGASFAAPVAFLGTLFIPTNSSLTRDGTLPDRPDVSYHYDLDTGTLALSRNGDLLYSGHAGSDGVFRDENDHGFGRALDGSLVLDPDALPGYAARPDMEAQPRARAQALAETETDENEPKLCPDPSQDRPGAREKDMAYQIYVSALVNPERPLLPGLGVRLPRADLDHLPDPANMNDWVYFDDCRLSDGTMIEAKGTGYLDMLNKGSGNVPWKGVEAGFLKQANSQLKAAGARGIEWYFAEEPVAQHVRKMFIDNNLPITVIVAPPPW